MSEQDLHATTGQSPAPSAERPLLEVTNLRVSFRTDEGLITPVDGVDYRVHRGKTLGIVGESGSGKSVSTRALMKLLPNHAIIDPASKMILNGRPNSLVERLRDPIDIAPLKSNSREIRDIRGGRISMIFQEPMASFSPVYTIGNQIAEAVRLHRLAGASPLAAPGTVGEQIAEAVEAKGSYGSGRQARKIAREMAVEMLDKVGISNAGLRVDQYPHELSGGMRQRAMIAVALSTHPELLIADEPTTALDVTIQAQILELIAELQRDLGMSVIFITHDMGVIAQVADEVAVMYLGRVVERGPTRALLTQPAHPYTRGLLEAIPRIEVGRKRLTPIPGDIPSPMERPKGCPFITRCAEKKPGLCDVAVPAEVTLSDSAAGTHAVRCVLHGSVPETAQSTPEAAQ
ncbi:MAG: ABC transporter ATP-binding protein [Rhodospirillaceae bacterium]